MGVASWLLILLGPFVGSGPVGGLALTEGRLAVALVSCLWWWGPGVVGCLVLA